MRPSSAGISPMGKKARESQSADKCRQNYPIVDGTDSQMGKRCAPDEMNSEFASPVGSGVFSAPAPTSAAALQPFSSDLSGYFRELSLLQGGGFRPHDVCIDRSIQQAGVVTRIEQV